MPKRQRGQQEYNSPPEMVGDATKRVRFGSEDIGEHGGQEFDFPNSKPRRGAVKDTEGYQSDSSDDGESIHTKPGPANADDDDDMFASTSAGVAGTTNAPDLDAKDNDTRVKDTGLELKGQAGKGGKEFLELGDIEGQEFTSSEAYSSANRQAREDMEKARKVYEDQEDYVEGEEHANDDDAVVPQERKDAEGMGFTISKFNMQEEMEEGRFSADGNYTRHNKDPDAVHDSWLSDLTTKDLAAAAAAKERQDALYASRNAAQSKGAPTRIDCLKQLLELHGGLVKPGESIQTALARLGKARKAEVEQEKERLKIEKRKNRSSNKPKRDFDAPDDPATHHPSTSTEKKDVETHDMDLDPLAPPTPTASSMNNKGKGKEVDNNATPTKAAIDALTTLASTLLGTHGETDIYEETHEGIIRQLIAEGEVPRGWKPNVQEASNGQGAADSSAKEPKEGMQTKSVISRPVIARPRA